MKSNIARLPKASIRFFEGGYLDQDAACAATLEALIALPTKPCVDRYDVKRSDCGWYSAIWPHTAESFKRVQGRSSAQQQADAPRVRRPATEFVSEPNQDIFVASRNLGRYDAASGGRPNARSRSYDFLNRAEDVGFFSVFELLSPPQRHRMGQTFVHFAGFEMQERSRVALKALRNPNDARQVRAALKDVFDASWWQNARELVAPGSLEEPDDPSVPIVASGLAAIYTNDYLYLVNLGIARAILCRQGKGQRLTVDHAVTEKSEQKRLRKLPEPLMACGVTRGLTLPSTSEGKGRRAQLSVAPLSEIRGGAIVLVTSKVTEVLTDDEIARCLAENATCRESALAQKVVELARQRGASGDLSSVVWAPQVPSAGRKIWLRIKALLMTLLQIVCRRPSPEAEILQRARYPDTDILF